MGPLKIKFSFIILLLLLPAFAEAIDTRNFIITIPGFPLSLGRSMFIICGLLVIIRDKKTNLKNCIFFGFALIFIGLFIASIACSNADAIQKSIAFILLLLGSLGIHRIWNSSSGFYFLDLFFTLTFIYWVVNSLSGGVLSGTITYSELYLKEEVINHHVPGMLISVSSVYIAVRFFYSDDGLRPFGFVVFLISLVTCLYLESRSNFLINFFIMSYLVLRIKGTQIRRLAVTIILFAALFSSLIHVIRNNEVLNRRFTFNDIDYQKRTTKMRFEYLNLGLNEFIMNPFGKGITDTRVEYRGNDWMIHNQYLTFLVGGGVISLIGLVVLFSGYIELFLKLHRLRKWSLDKTGMQVFSLLIACITFFITLFTVEMSGLFFFFIVSFIFHVYREIITFSPVYGK